MSDAVDPLAWETTSSEVVYEDVTLPDGEETDFDYLSEPPAVVVLPFVDETPQAGAGGLAAAEVVVIEEWRQAVDRVNRGLPAGGTEPGDSDLETAARRELLEETGYDAGNVEHLCTVEPANGLLDSVHHVYVATGCEPAGEQALDADETIRVDTTTFGDLLAAVRDGTTRDGRTHLAVTRYALDAELEDAPNGDDTGAEEPVATSGGDGT